MATSFEAAYAKFANNPAALGLRDIYALKEHSPDLAIAAAEAVRAALERKQQAAQEDPMPVVRMERPLPVVKLQRPRSHATCAVMRTPPSAPTMPDKSKKPATIPSESSADMKRLDLAGSAEDSVVTVVARYLSTTDEGLAEATARLLPHLKRHQRADIVLPLLMWSREVNKKNIERNSRIQALESRIATLEARPGLKWAGTHVAGAHYPESSIVTRSGGLWVATKATQRTPGTPEGIDHWRLIVKGGTHSRP